AILPIQIAVGRSGKETIESGRIRAEAGDHYIGRDHIAEAFGHLSAILDHHTLCKQAFGRLVILDHAKVAHELSPKTRVDQMKDRVFNSSNVLVNGKPIAGCLQTERGLVVMGVSVAVEVP